MTDIEKELMKILDANKASSLNVLDKASKEDSVLGVKYNIFSEKIRNFYDSFILNIKNEIRNHYDDVLMESVFQSDGVTVKNITEATKYINSKHVPVVELSNRLKERIYKVLNFEGLYVGIVTNPKLGDNYICDIKYYHESETVYDNKTELIYTGEDFKYAEKITINPNKK